MTPPNVGKDVEQWELIFNAGGRAKWYRHSNNLMVSYKTKYILSI